MHDHESAVRGALVELTEGRELGAKLAKLEERLMALEDEMIAVTLDFEDRVAALEFEAEDDLVEMDPVVEQAEDLFEDYADELVDPHDAFVAGYIEGHEADE